MAEFLGKSNVKDEITEREIVSACGLAMTDDEIQKLIQEKQTLEKKIAAMSNVLADYAGEIITLKVKIQMLEQNGNPVD